MSSTETPLKGAAAPARRTTGARTPATRGTRSWLPALGLNLAALAAGLGVWALLAATGVQALPGPATVAGRAAELIADGTLAQDALASLRRVLIGFALGTLTAVPIGFLMGWYPVARGLLEPYIQFFRTIPPLALIPLAIVLMGIGEMPKIFVIFLAAFLSSVVAAFQGVIGVDRTLIDAARVLGARDGTIFLQRRRPGVHPVHPGRHAHRPRLGLGDLVAAELIAAQEGLGFRMQQAPALLRPAHDLRRPDHHRRPRAADGPRAADRRTAPHRAGRRRR